MKAKGFGYGWSMIFYAALLFMLGAGITVDGLNVIIPAISESRGWDYNTVLSYSSIGGLVGFLGTVFFSQLVVKKGVRFMTVTALLMSGVATIVYSHVTSISAYILTLCVLFFTVNGYSFIAPTTLITTWFPRKKGIAFGIATIGLPLSTALFVPLLAILFSKFGFTNGLTFIGIFTILLAIVSIFWIKNTPEEMGLAPDGDILSSEEIKEQSLRIKDYKTSWTISRLLKSSVVWTISIGYGLIFLVTVGIMSQLVPRIMSLGFEQNKALALLSLCALIGIIGSYFWGWLDQKTSTKKASIALAAWYIIALILLIVSKNDGLLIFAIVMVGFGIGGIGNLQPSMLAQVFGRLDYASANRIVPPIISLIRILAFAVMGVALTVTGSFDGAYIVLIVINIIALLFIFAIKDTCIGAE